MKRTALALCLTVAGAAAAHALTLPASKAIGAVYPGARVSAREQRPECGESYRFKVSAPLAQVARFYLAQGEAAGLQLTSGPPKAGADYRMILFAEKQPPAGRILFVMLDADGPQVAGGVYYHASRARSCP